MALCIKMDAKSLFWKLTLFLDCCRTTEVLFLKQPVILPFLCHESATTGQSDSNKVSNSKLKLDLLLHSSHTNGHNYFGTSCSTYIRTGILTGIPSRPGSPGGPLSPGLPWNKKHSFRQRYLKGPCKVNACNWKEQTNLKKNCSNRKFKSHCT